MVISATQGGIKIREEDCVNSQWIEGGLHKKSIGGRREWKKVDHDGKPGETMA